MVVALLALFVALSGASYAAVSLPRNSVGSKQIRNNAVVSSKVRNGSLLAEDFMAGQLPRGERGETGERGPAGSPGATGAEGPRGPSDLYWALGSQETILTGSATYFTAGTIVVPPGNYRLSATLTVRSYFNSSYSPIAPGVGTKWAVDCHLNPTDGPSIADGYAGTKQVRQAYDEDLVPMSLEGVLERPGAASSVTVNLRCARLVDPGNSNVETSVRIPTLTAIKVATSTPIPN